MEIGNLIMWLLMIISDWITFPYFWITNKITNKNRLPSIDDEIVKFSATKLSEMIRKRKITCEKVITSYIKRIKDVQPVINAVVEDRFVDALKDAKAIDKMLMDTSITEEELKRKRPLLGVPFTVKESCGLKGLSYSVGFLRYKGRKADSDGEAVLKLKIAGAIPLLVSNTPELCFSWDTRNHITGVTNNPYDPACSAAGSSGGEGALIGSGASVFGIGSDLAGSIRLPAMFNGIFGHKPTPRIISIKGHFPCCTNDKFQDLLVVGPMARYAEDLTLLTDVLCQNPTELKLSEKVNLSSVKIFTIDCIDGGWLYPSVSNEIKDAIESSANHFMKNFGCKVSSLYFDELEKMADFGIPFIVKYSQEAPNLLKDPDSKKERN